MYIFANYMDEDTELEPNRDYLKNKLIEAGFDYSSIDSAFEWLEELSTETDAAQGIASSHSIRIYNHFEIARLSLEARGFLLFLEQSGILNPATREQVIERIMALDTTDELDIEEIKWIIMMVMFKQADDKTSFGQIEDIVFDYIPGYTQ